MNPTVDIQKLLGYQEQQPEIDRDKVLLQETQQALRNAANYYGFSYQKSLQQIDQEVHKRLRAEHEAMELVGRISKFLTKHLEANPKEETEVAEAASALNYQNICKIISTANSVLLMELDPHKHLTTKSRSGPAKADELKGSAALIAQVLHEENSIAATVDQGSSSFCGCGEPWTLTAKARYALIA
jgi:hypothetical protein